MKKNLIASVLKGMTLFVLTLAVCKYSKGVGAAAIVGIAFCLAVSGKIGWALVGYILFPFMVIMNPYLLPKEGITSIVLRLGPVIVTGGLLISGAMRPGKHQIPMEMIWLFLVVAVVSSIGGYYPEISYLKIINCAILFIGLQLGFRNIDKRPDDVEVTRKFLLVITSFVIWGSLFVLIFMPGIAYMTSLHSLLNEAGSEVANMAVKQADGPLLFGGVTNQAQCLAVVLPASLVWLACDMFFIERRVTLYHSLTVFAGLPLIYLTRSRAAMLTSGVAMVMMYFYCMKHINIRPALKNKMKSAMNGAVFLIIVACVVSEVRSNAITKWMRKRESYAEQGMNMQQSLTQSRMGQVEANMYDFKRNPLLGSGFQVSYDMKYTFKGHKGLILSASIEKGILPLMVLGETGVLGAIVFLLFLISFYAGCKKRQLYCTSTLMTVFLASNMAEATFFSPGGIGGILWVLCIGGGFVLDTGVIYRHRLARIAQEQQFAMMQQQMEGGI